MSILFVLLTFLLILTVMYFRRPQEAAATLQVATARKLNAPVMLKHASFDVPEDYALHPGHTWVMDEGRQNARVGIDAFAGNLFGKIDSIEIADLNRWVRQGQKLCTVTREGQSIDLLSPVEGVLISVNHEVLKNPNLIVDDPYKNGWLCVVKAPELSGLDAEQHGACRRNAATPQSRPGARRRPAGQGPAFPDGLHYAATTGEGILSDVALDGTGQRRTHDKTKSNAHRYQALHRMPELRDRLQAAPRIQHRP